MFKKFLKRNALYIALSFICTVILVAVYMFCESEAAENAKIAPIPIVCEAAATLQAEAETAPTFAEMEVTATAYCPCADCCGKCDGITATGTKAKAGRTIAVDPSVIPYGTEVIINGHTYIAEDCGGAIKGNRVDVYFDTHAEAAQFGRQVVTVQIKNDFKEL